VLTDKGERLARVSIVNFYGNIVFDTLVKPCSHYYEEHEVLDYREWITGIKPIDLDHAPTFGNIEPIVSEYIIIYQNPFLRFLNLKSFLKYRSRKL
jgi:RNA exonuclease 4